MTSVADRPTAWWLATLQRRADSRTDDVLHLGEPIDFSTDEERRAALKFFNAAYRAEESGLSQAHALAARLAESDPELAETFRMYGDEEGWHRELLTGFLAHLGGGVQPMGRVTTLLYRLYARAERMDTILLTNLMFETIGSTTYRMALGRIRHPAFREMLTILTRDEAFHVPLNVHFMKRALEGSSRVAVFRLRLLFSLVYVALVCLPLASRPKSRAFDRLDTLELSRAYARELARVFGREPGLPLEPPKWLLSILGVDLKAVLGSEGPAVTSVEAAESAARRDGVHIREL
ncbi:MAG TPA: ferritin-like domain-containing protein [Polyangiaceae bacterium]|nr:ferritin-like domain-containing protein [Polyangiaceae bacterium]